MSEPAVEVRDVTKRFRRYGPAARHTTLKTALVSWLSGRRDGIPGVDRFDALHGVSFTLARGTTLGVIGRNGAGKSTLLRLLAGIYQPDAGRVAVRGRVAALIELGAGFHPDFTGRENVLINGIILGLSRREVRERFDRIVSFAGVEEFIDAPLRTWSSGMMLRLGFSIAVHVEPDVLLIDEVIAVGDEAFQARCREVIERRTRSGDRITVIASHDLLAVEALCKRVLVLDPPHAELFDRPAEGIEHYRRLSAAPPPASS